MIALASLLLVFVLPAVAGAVALGGSGWDDSADRPSGVDPYVVIARGLACGLAAWLFGSGLLAATVDLTSGSAWAWDGAVAAASLLVLLLPRNRSRLRAALGPPARRLVESTGVAAIVYVPLAYVIVQTSWSPLGSTPWYYFGLARQVADAGSVPSMSIEFGTTTPFLNDYHLFTTGTAMLLVQHPDGPMTVITVITLLSVLLLGVGAAAVTSSLGAGRLTALLAVPIVVASGIGPTRLAGYRPEGFALGLTLLLVALGIDWLRRRDWRSLATAAVLAATLSQVHGIAASAAAVLIGAAAMTSLMRGQRAEQLRRAGVALAALLGAVVVTGLIFREASGTVHAGGLVDRGGLADPTWAFYEAARDLTPSMPPSNTHMIVDTLHDTYYWSRWGFVPILLLAILGLGLRWRDPVARRTIGFTLVSLIGLAALASIFMFGWQGYVPRRTGASRLVLEATLLAPPVVAIGLSCLAHAASRRWSRLRRLGERPGALAMILVAAVLGVITLIPVADYDDSQAPTSGEVAVLQSLPLTSSDVVLANGYTEGFIPDVTGADGLLDGRAPYTFGDLLRRANQLFRGAQGFFDDPAENWDFLAKHDVTWVVVADSDSHSLGTGNIWDTPPNLKGLEQCAGLQRVVEDGALTAFRVVDDSPDGCG